MVRNDLGHRQVVEHRVLAEEVDLVGVRVGVRLGVGVGLGSGVVLGLVEEVDLAAEVDELSQCGGVLLVQLR